MNKIKLPAAVVSALIIDDKNRIFLAEHPRWTSKWAIPGGKIRYGEKMIEALQREISEETGLIILEANFLRISESILDPSFRDGTWHLIFIDFVCRKFKNEVQLDNHELTKFTWVNLDDALKLHLTPSTRESIQYLIEKSSSEEYTCGFQEKKDS